MADKDAAWAPDILGGAFEYRHIDHPDDYDGTVRSTLVRRLPQPKPAKAVLYVHGFSDYFFQSEMAERFVEAGYGFYAVDLRKYGRSLLPGQTMFRVRDLHEYFPDIVSAIDLIKADGIDSIVLLGHSTGGLTSALYMASNPAPEIRALVLNSPFLDWNLPTLQKAAVPLLSAIGRFFPGLTVRQKPDSGYAETLHRELGGEWDYRRDWKPDVLPDVDAGWVRAIDRAQRELRHGHIRVPVLLLHSAESVRLGDPKEKYGRADAILDVESIGRYGCELGDDVTEVTVDDGLHDLVLSARPVRERVYTDILRWLAALPQSPSPTASQR